MLGIQHVQRHTLAQIPHDPLWFNMSTRFLLATVETRALVFHIVRVRTHIVNLTNIKIIGYKFGVGDVFNNISCSTA